MASFDNKKQLRFIITLGTGKFGTSSNNVITIQGLRARISIDKAGGMQMGQLKARIFGVSQSDMNAITVLQWGPRSLIPNTVEVYAIDGAVETLVFAGNIVNAWGDYQSIPDVCLQIEAQAAYFQQIKPVPPRSFKGAVDVVSVMAQIARSMGYSLENNGVTAQLRDVYLHNTDMAQARELAQMAGVDLYVDDKIMAICPHLAPRNSLIPLISASTGMIGYPTFDGVGINTRILFNPSVTFGGKIKIESDIPRANGEWVVSSVSHTLDCETPNGEWSSQIRGSLSGLVVTK